MLHEMIHYSVVDFATSLMQQIQDMMNINDLLTYNSSHAHDFLNLHQDDNLVITKINVDNYA